MKTQPMSSFHSAEICVALCTGWEDPSTDPWRAIVLQFRSMQTWQCKYKRSRLILRSEADVRGKHTLAPDLLGPACYRQHESRFVRVLSNAS